jgi:hypothetical protein
METMEFKIKIQFKSVSEKKAKLFTHLMNHLYEELSVLEQNDEIIDPVAYEVE